MNKSSEDISQWQNRTVRLLGSDSVNALANSKVLVVGVGGVGGYAVEMLARTGVGNITIIDSDEVSPSNINRQLIALRSAVGESKVLLWKRRIHDINPQCNVTAIDRYVTAENVEELLSDDYHYVIDCIDTVAPKVALIEQCMRRKIRIISSMGAGGRTDVTKVAYMDLWETREDGLARAVRERMKQHAMRRPLRVVASTEAPRTQSLIEENRENKKSSLGTIASIPAVFGIFLANHVLRELK